MKPICSNPYMNTVAQVVEIFHSAYDSLRLIDELLASGVKDEELVKPTVFASGAGATEVPRGILFHEYAYDQDGMCLGGNCVIPTNQNHGNIQRDFEKLVPELAVRREEREGNRTRARDARPKLRPLRLLLDALHGCAVRQMRSRRL